MPGYNFNHFTGKTKSGNTRKSRKKKERKTRMHTNKYEKYSNKKSAGVSRNEKTKRN